MSRPMTSRRSGRASLPSRDDTATCPSPGSTVPRARRSPTRACDAIRDYLTHSSSNTHGAFAASAETDALIAGTRSAVADLLGATDPDEIAFGPNMTTITFALSRAIGASLAPGDEIVLTRMDHDANVAPWLAIARERDLVVRWVGVEPDDCTLRLDDLDDALGPRTRLVAVGLASNAVGTINPVREIADRVHAVGAHLWVDAVHGAPHLPIDVATLGADFLVCSAYKVYGPHLGILWGRRELLEALPPYHVRPAGDAIPGRFETGTLAHELLAGLAGTLRHLEWLGVTQGGGPGEAGDADGRRPERLRAALERLARPRARPRGVASSSGSVPSPASGSAASPTRGAPRSAAPRSRSRSTAGTRRMSPATSASAGSSSGTATTTPGSSSARSGWPIPGAWSGSGS